MLKKLVLVTLLTFSLGSTAWAADQEDLQILNEYRAWHQPPCTWWLLLMGGSSRYRSEQRNLRVDWTAPHRDNVRSAVRAAVKRTLRQHRVRPEDFDRFVDSVMGQAEISFAEWPLAA